MPWGVVNYNSNPALNTNINGTDIAELSSAAGYNDALRQIMADIAVWVSTGLATLGGLDAAYRDLIFTGKSGAFNIDNSERAYAINYTGAAAAATIRPQSVHAIDVGAVYVIRNGGTGVLTLTRGSGVLLQPNGLTSNDVPIAIGGVVTLINWGSDTWTVSGSGI